MTDLQKIKDEFQEFMNSDALPSPAIGQRVLSTIETAMRPSPFLVFSKLCLGVLCAGLITLLLCPQFGIGFMRHSGLLELFMYLGHYGCKVMCGAFFVGMSVFVSTFVLLPEDLRVLRKHCFLQVAAVAALALSAFVALGGEIFFVAALAWFSGGLIGGLASLEFGFRLRFALAKA